MRKLNKATHAMALALGLGAFAGSAQAILIDNGITGDGFWQVDVQNGGESRNGNLDPTGSPDGITGATDVIYDYFHYVDVGADGGAVQLGNTTVTTAAHLSGNNQVTSAGSFAGQNGTIFWTSVSSIAAGSPLYQTTLSFSSANPFGVVRLSQYLDEDVMGVNNDNLVVIGTPGASDFQLLTIDGTYSVGVSHSAGYASALGASYIGWAADQYSALGNAITGAGAAYSIAGVVNTGNLPPISDPRFPGNPVYGPNDITSAIAFDLNPLSTSASITFALGGLPSGEVPPSVDPLPEPASFSLFGLGLAALGFVRRKQRKA